MTCFLVTGFLSSDQFTLLYVVHICAYSTQLEKGMVVSHYNKGCVPLSVINVVITPINDRVNGLLE